MNEWTLLLWFLAGMFVGRHITISYSQAYRNSRNMIDTAIAREREACAEVCDSEATTEGIAQRCAAAIRARGEPEQEPVKRTVMYRPADLESLGLTHEDVVKLIKEQS